MNISIFGTGYVGLVTGACLANLGHNVICVDIDEKKIQNLKQGIIPFFEPNLPNLVKKNVQKQRLKFTCDSKFAIDNSSAIFNCVGTPQNADGSANLEYIKQVTKTIAENVNNNEYKILINKSTVPPGTAKLCQELIQKINPNCQIDLVSNPEFLKEGAAVHDFTHPNRIVIGTKNPDKLKAKQIIKKVYLGRSRLYIPFIETNWETAELIKYASNSFLATKISFINEIANISDKIGADIKVVAQAMGMDYRISPKFLGAGIGYGGSCFPKDVRALANYAKTKGYQANLLTQVDKNNELQKKIIVQKILNFFQTKQNGAVDSNHSQNTSLNNKNITILGLSFKPKTSDVREAPSIPIIIDLLKKGAKINAYDPIANKEFYEYLKSIFNKNSSLNNDLLNNFNLHGDIISASQNSDALVLITEWDEFRNLDLDHISQIMRTKVIFDGRNIYEPEQISSAGFKYFGIGRSE